MLHCKRKYQGVKNYELILLDNIFIISVINNNITIGIEYKNILLNKLADNTVVEVSIVLNINFDNIKLKAKLNIPCINFNNIYLTIDILFLLIKDEVCAIADNPAKEAKKLIIANLRCIVRLLEAIMLQPLVNSMLPKNVPYKTFLGILKNFSI